MEIDGFFYSTNPKFSIIDQALGLMNYATIKDSKVVLEAKGNNRSIGQEWLRSKPDDEGWFTFRNPISGRYLTAASNNSTTITGMYQAIKHLFCKKHFLLTSILKPLYLLK